MFLLQNFYSQKNFSQSLGGCQSWQLWNIYYSYPLLVNIEYLFYYQSSSFEIWYTCCQPNNDFVPKISCINNNFLALRRVSKLATMWALSLELHKATISVSPHCTWGGGKHNFHNYEGIHKMVRKPLWLAFVQFPSQWKFKMLAKEFEAIYGVHHHLSNWCITHAIDNWRRGLLISTSMLNVFLFGITLRHCEHNIW
jgi:hypothetical protein